MLLTISKKEFDKDFVYNYLPFYMYSILKESIDQKQIERLNKSYKFDSKEVLLKSFLKLRISNDENSYYISIDKNLKYNNLFVNQLVKMINYGNLTTKGYPIIDNVFNFIKRNLDLIYEKWKLEI